MKSPKEIYLQVGEGEEETPEPPDGVTWCQDKIFDSDIKYIRADLVSSIDYRGVILKYNDNVFI